MTAPYSFKLISATGVINEVLLEILYCLFSPISWEKKCCKVLVLTGCITLWTPCIVHAV